MMVLTQNYHGDNMMCCAEQNCYTIKELGIK